MSIGRLGKVAAIYFAVVFGVGFALGPIRVLWLEPRLGLRAAELVEAPFMLVAIIVAGRWVGRRLCSSHSPTFRLSVGLLAAGLVLAADVGVGVGLRDMSVTEVFTVRDPVSGSVYYALVALTAVAPWLLGLAPAHCTHGERT
jgi:MFS family permease